MKVILPIVLFGLSVLSGNNIFSQGNSKNSKDKSSVENNSHAPVRTNSTETTDYVSRVYNACVPEWVNLKGQVTYSIKEMRSDSRYFIIYKINLQQVRGIGESTGDMYKGGGIIMNKVNANFDNGHTVGSDRYQVRYKSANTSLTISEKAHFVFANGSQKISFNDSSDTCK
ncbi:MAG: hypothetical protein ABIO81_05700 [Ginsengibacter sp.]